MKHSQLNLLSIFSIMFIGLASSLLCSTAHAGADVFVNRAQHEVVLKAHFVFYGNGDSTEASVVNAENVKKITQEIETMWSTPGLNVTFAKAGQTEEDSGLDEEALPQVSPTPAAPSVEIFSFRTELTSEILSQGDALKKARLNRKVRNNYILLLQGGPRDRSYLTAIGANTGVFYLSEDLGNSTIAAHEFGHMLGLAHPNSMDWRKTGQPGIMCSNGTLVDSNYQINPYVVAGEMGGTLQATKRKVIQFDVTSLRLSTRKYIKDHTTLGKLSNLAVSSRDL